MALDHVLVTPSLRIEDYEVLNCSISDHRPIAVTIGHSEDSALHLQ